MKSQTIRKYPENFIFWIIWISRSSRSAYSGRSCFRCPLARNASRRGRRFSNPCPDLNVPGSFLLLDLVGGAVQPLRVFGQIVLQVPFAPQRFKAGPPLLESLP